MKRKYIIGVGLVIAIIATVSIGIIVNKNNTDLNNITANNDVADENEDGFETYTYITDEMLENSETSTMYAELKSEFTPEIMFNESDAIALVTITTIDGASMEYSAYGMTYGTMVVDNIIYGNIEVNENGLVGFFKPGGLVSIADYDAHDNQAAVEKRDYLREQAGIEIDKENSYMNLKVENDVELEVGKTYLAYLHFRDKYGKYEIVGLRNGLREVNVAQQTRVKTQSLDLNNIQIKNNVTGEWEDLDQYIQENIEVYE